MMSTCAEVHPNSTPQICMLSRKPTFRLSQITERMVGMPSTLRQRIKAARLYAQLTQEQLAERLGVTKSAVSMWETPNNVKQTNPTLDNLRGISRETGAPMWWLSDDNQDIEGIWMEPSEVVPLPVESPDEKYAYIRQFDVKGSCGTGCQIYYVETRGSLAFKKDWLAKMHLDQSKAKVIYALGDSMAPTICDGDVVLVDESQCTPVSSHIYLFLHDNELYIKRLFRTEGKWIMRSDNWDKLRYPDENLGVDSKLLGRIVWRGGGV